jgi:predicted Zn-dependent protease
MRIAFRTLFLAGVVCALGVRELDAQARDASFQRGSAFYRGSDCLAAIPELQAAAGSNPRANLLLGRCYMETQQIGKAIEALTNYRKAAPGDDMGVIALAEAQEQDGHGDDATAVLEQYLREHPDKVVLQNKLGDLYLRQGQNSKAMESYHTVTNQHPDDPGARIGLGLVALSEQRWQEAIDEFAKAREAAPEDYRLLAGLGQAFVHMGDCGQAVSPLRQALDLAPDDFPLAKTLAQCYQKAQRWTDVLTALRTGTRQEAADEESTKIVTQALLAVNDKAGAEAYYRRVIGLAPANVTAHTDLGDLLDKANRPKEARAEYLEVVKLQPDFPRIHERLGEMAQDQKETAEARSHFQAAANSKNGADSARIKLARLCFGEKDLACTVEAVDKITDPGLGHEVKLLRAQVAYQQMKWTEAGELANELLKDEPQNLTLLGIAADVADHQDRPNDAVLYLERLLALNPTDQGRRFDLARLYINNPDLNGLNRAVDKLREYLDKYGQEPKGYLLLGRAYQQLNDPTNAKINYKLGFDRVLPPIPADFFDYYNSYGVMMLQSGDYPEAYAALTRAAHMDKPDELALLNFALACLHLGRTEELENTRADLEKLHSKYLASLDEEIDRQKKAAVPKK